MKETKRIFLGSFIPDETLYRFFEKIKPELDKEAVIKWTRTPENLHLTWHFFGNMPVDKIKILQKVLSGELEKTFEIPVTITGLNYFKRKNKPAVLYAAVKDESGELYRLFETIQQKLYEHKLIPQKSTRFTPHITLGRIKKTGENFERVIQNLNRDFQPVPFKIFIPQIIESILSPQGALYKPLQI